MRRATKKERDLDKAVGHLLAHEGPYLILALYMAARYVPQPLVNLRGILTTDERIGEVLGRVLPKGGGPIHLEISRRVMAARDEWGLTPPKPKRRKVKS